MTYNYKVIAVVSLHEHEDEFEIIFLPQPHKRRKVPHENFLLSVYLPIVGNIFPFWCKKRSLAITYDSSILSLTNKVPNSK